MRFLFIVFFIFASCQNKPKSNSEITSIDSCSDRIKYTNLISKSIDLPALQQYYNVQDGFNQKYLVVLNNNEYLNCINQLNKFDIPVKLLDSIKIKQEGIKAYLEYKEIEIINDTAKIYYRYDVQGIGIKSSYFLKDCEWYLVNSHLWEN